MVRYTAPLLFVNICNISRLNWVSWCAAMSVIESGSLLQYGIGHQYLFCFVFLFFLIFIVKHKLFKNMVTFTQWKLGVLVSIFN